MSPSHDDQTPTERAQSRITVGALLLAAAWVAIWAVSTYRVGQVGLTSQIEWLLLALGLFMPLGLIAVAWTLGRIYVQFREEIPQLVNSIQSLRSTIAQSKTQDPAQQIASVSARLDHLTSQSRHVSDDLKTIKHMLHTPVAAPLLSDQGENAEPDAPFTDGQQGQLDLIHQTDLSTPLSVTDVIKALNFPQNENDTDGFALFARAMGYHPTAQILRAAQDILTLLSEDGIFMDDLSPSYAHPNLWRRFAQGERGQNLSEIAGITDKTALSLVSGRMRVDGIFRDAAHHFLRQFDKTITQMAPHCTDEDLHHLSDTRTARAFMIIARVTGTFD